jgi:hypothetical protein
MSNTESYLRYEILSDKSFKVFSDDRKKYEIALKPLGAIWNPRMKPEPGWFIPRKNENELKEVIRSFLDPANLSAQSPVVSEKIK